MSGTDANIKMVSQNRQKTSHAQKFDVQLKSRLAYVDANHSMLNDAFNFSTANSTNMFVEKFCAHRQAATLEALNFNAQENGCFSFFDTLIPNDANNNLNFSAIKD
jgi:hypothetical protein